MQRGHCHFDLGGRFGFIRRKDVGDVMKLSVSFENTRDAPLESGPVTVGWFLNTQKGAIIYDAPARVRSVPKLHASSSPR